MVAQPHLTLTLEALGSTGVVLPLEQKVRAPSTPRCLKSDLCSGLCKAVYSRGLSADYSRCAGGSGTFIATQASKGRAAQLDLVGQGHC